MTDRDDSIFVFRDKGGKRWTRLRHFFLFGSVLFFLAAVLFVRYLITTPRLQSPVEVQQLRVHLQSIPQVQGDQSGFTASPPLWLRFRNALPTPHTNKTDKQPPAGHSDGKSKQREIRLGFYVDWDPDSHQSLMAHADELTHVSPEWLTLIDGNGNLTVNADQKLLKTASEKHVVVLPMLRNLVGNTWVPEAVEGLVSGPPERQDHFISALSGHLAEAEAGGVLIDWNQVDPAYRPQITSFLKRLSAALHSREMELWLCIPVGLDLKAFDLEALSPVVDRFVAMLHDENSEMDPPGPIASQPWFDGWIDTMLGYGQPSQWIIAIGSYGYDWAQGEKEASVLSFIDVMGYASRAGLQNCRMEPPAYNPHFSYKEGATEHEIWFLDGVSFFNQLKKSRGLQVGGIAVSRLGTEDPSLWAMLSPSDQAGQNETAVLSSLRIIDSTNSVAQVGKGNFLSIEENQTKGYREITIDAAGLATSAYQLFPGSITIVHQGRGAPDEAAISFDDGPDPDWTTAILDILKAKEVKASFFMVGERMEQHPGLVRRILNEGHEVGVHTYTHPNLAEVSGERARLELNATQRLLEAITGHSTLLFRPPYNADSQPHSVAEIAPLRIAHGLGYLTVSSDIDPEDWERPGTATIVQRVKEQRPWGNIVLLHDAGGNRSQTVEALPLIIDYLEARGDRIVPLSRLLGTSGSSFLLPVPKSEQSMLRLIGNSGFSFLHLLGELCWSFMIIATVLVTLRTLLVAGLAQMNLRRALPGRTTADASFSPPVSIIIAAYNEEKVIGRTMETLQNSEYGGNLEMIIINDGSNDKTAAVVEELAKQDRRIRLISQMNTGKARALQRGFLAARQEIIVTLDADTNFKKDTIAILVQAIRDEKVGAVSGHILVGNQQRLVARFQALEYICGFNLDRRAYQQLNCITVVPGAASAWRKSAVMAAGGISSDTLAEDTDLTLSLHRAGYQIGYAPKAVAWTEAPETYTALVKQRFRWAFGTLQSLWKHRDLVGNPHYKALGWFSLPSIWFFQILLVAIGPVADGMLIFSFAFGLGLDLLYYLLAFFAMDLLLAVLACWMDEEPVAHAWRILPMRFIYRPLLAWVIWKSLIRAAKGALVGWDKLERTASIVRT